jgi:two-component system OmpR family sensor kinase
MRRSLSGRLLLTLISAQIGAIMLAMLAFPLLAPFESFNDIADTTFRAHIVASLKALPNGQLTVASSPALRTYVARRPGAAFAVYDLDQGEVAAGSDPLLAKWLTQLNGFYPEKNGNLTSARPDGLPGTLLVTAEASPYGELVIATVGNQFHAEDIPSVMLTFLPAILPIYGPVILGALVILPVIVILITRPLRRLAATAAVISPMAPGVRLPEDGLAPELKTLAQSLNAALGRIEEGFTKQRLYAANAAHELRMPIAILSIHLEDLPDSPAKHRLEFDLARIAALVDQLVAVARLGQQAAPMNEEVDLVSMARDVIADRAPIAIRNGREIALEADHAVRILGNSAALTSAVANVLDNAIRAEPQAGTVVVRVSRNGCLDIVDHGNGIAAEDKPMIFEPFWRKSVSGDGTGLGLAIVREITDRHGIQLAVEDTSGGGATFRFDFQTRVLP